MPAVALMVCQTCGETSRRVMADRQTTTTMPPCPSCGGHRQVSRVFYDRRLRAERVDADRRAR
jgi:ribosomal protein L32